MNFSEIDNSYVASAVTRIGTALAALTKWPVIYGPPEAYSRDADAGTFWFVDALSMTPTDQAVDLGVQTWGALAQLVYKGNQSKADPKIYSAMYTTFPMAFNYMKAHKALIFSDDQDGLPYLQKGGVTIELQGLNAAGQAGFIMLIRLPFSLLIDQEY